jgi:hypothetical protein
MIIAMYLITRIHITISTESNEILFRSQYASKLFNTKQQILELITQQEEDTAMLKNIKNTYEREFHTINLIRDINSLMEMISYLEALLELRIQMYLVTSSLENLKKHNTSLGTLAYNKFYAY